MYLNRLFPRSLKPLTHLQLRTVFLQFSVFRRLHSFHLPIQKVPFLRPPSAPHFLPRPCLTGHIPLDCSAHRICRTSLLPTCFSSLVFMNGPDLSLFLGVLCWCAPQDTRSLLHNPAVPVPAWVGDVPREGDVNISDSGLVL